MCIVSAAIMSCDVVQQHLNLKLVSTQPRLCRGLSLLTSLMVLQPSRCLKWVYKRVRSMRGVLQGSQGGAGSLYLNKGQGNKDNTGKTNQRKPVRRLKKSSENSRPCTPMADKMVHLASTKTTTSNYKQLQLQETFSSTNGLNYGQI